MSRFYRAPLLLAAVASVGLAASPAMAACTRLAFSVNDYGKEGPTNDAKRLLDTYIAKKMTERGIAKYTTGKKDVTCELFLDFVVFDEYTCKAEASVCWDEAAKPAESALDDASIAKPVAAPAAPAKTKEQSAKAPAAAAPAETATPAAAKIGAAEDHSKVGGTVKTVETPAAAPSSPSGNSFVASDPETAKSSDDKQDDKQLDTTTGSVSSPVVPPMTP